MKFAAVFFSFFILGATSVAFSQGAKSSPTPPPASPPRPEPSPTPPRMSTNVQAVADETLRMSQFARGSAEEPNHASLRVIYLQRYVAPMYRKPTDDELAAVEPASAVKELYADFLRQANTGIVRLIPDHGCAGNDRVVSAAEECIKYSMPGAGSSFSFRTENYRLPQLADITYDGKRFDILGQFVNGMLADIGNLPIQNVTLTTPGVLYPSGFTPVTEFTDAIATDRVLRNGVAKDGFQYSKSAASVEGSTYVLRNVAFRGKAIRAIHGIAYNELDFDKRKDVLVVFKVAAIDPDGSVTIVWKQLAESDSPKLKAPKKQDGDDSDRKL